MMIPAKRLYFLLISGLAIAPVLAIFFTIPFAILGVIVYDLLILSLAWWENRQNKHYLVKVTRLPLHNLSIGRNNPVNLTLSSPKRPILIQIQDTLPPTFQTSDLPLSVQLLPHQAQSLTYQVFPSERGEYAWGDLIIRQLGQWELTWQEQTLKSSQKIAVYPDLVGLRSLSVRLTLENTGTMRQARQRGMGTDFRELREYHKGDDLRLMDWKATARRNHPFLRVLEPEKEQTLIILLDRGRLMTAEVEGLKRFDWGLNAALSLALAGLHRGDRVGIGVFDKEMKVWIAPNGGISHLTTLIEKLTPLQPVFLEPDYLGAVTQVVNQQPRRALVVLLTDIIDNTASAELLGAMARLSPRYLPFCIALRDPQVDRLAHQTTEQLDQAYRRAVALDLLSQRQRAFAPLKQKGILVLDAPVHQITEQLVNRYLDLKLRNLL